MIRNSSDIAFDEVREKSLTPPEVGIFPDGSSVHPPSENLDLNSEEVAGIVDDIASTNGENLQQTENNVDSPNQDSNTSKIDMDDNLSGLNEFWELVEPNVKNDVDKVSELNFSLQDIDEPVNQEMDRGLPVEPDKQSEDKTSIAVKSGDLDKKPMSNNNPEVLKTYPKRTSRNKPPKYYGWSSYNPLNWV